MENLTRRNFLGVASAAAAAALAACNAPQGGGEAPAPDAGDALAAPDASAYPIEPDAEGTEAKWTAEETADGWIKITQEGAPTLGIADQGKIIQVAGYAFKDLNGSGKLELWEDWRQDPQARSEALAAEMGVEDLLPHIAMLFFTFMNMSGELTDDEKAAIDSGRRAAMIGVENTTQDIRGWAEHYNKIQAYAEGSGTYGIPMHYCGDPINGNYEIAGKYMPSQPGIGASFDPEVAKQVGDWVSRMFSASGVNMNLGPQIDTTTEPTWGRAEGTYGEDPALVRDLARGFVDGLQSTYVDGKDTGWGPQSVIACVKHYPGDGASQFGRDSHGSSGRFSIYPNGNFLTQLIPFVDGVFKLDGATGAAGAIMPSYSIAYSEDGEYGELMGTAFSAYKMSLAKAYGWDGLSCSDWQILDDDGEGPFGMPMAMHNWGAKHLSRGERTALAIKCGTHLYGGQDDPTPVNEAYDVLVEQEGQEEADAIVRGCCEEIFRALMKTGKFENTYLDADASRELVYNDADKALARELCQKAIVMLKNDGVVAKDFIGADAQVYVPVKFTPASAGMFGPTPASAALPIPEDVLGQYFQLVTDTIGEPTGEADADGNPTLQLSDIARADAAALAECQYAVVFDAAPYKVGSGMFDTGENGYLPTTLQYAPFTADAASGCPEQSLAHNDADGNDENLSPFGNTNVVDNSDLPANLAAIRAALPEGAKIILVLSANNPFVPAEVEPLVDALLVSYTKDGAAMLDIVTGKVEPSGLLPWQQPKDMTEVYSQASDTPRDMECYVDAAGNTYDFGYGLNWSGVIDDERTKKYCIAPILVPESACDESLIVK